MGIPKEELLADVETFATEFGLTEQLPLLRKGALLAQNPAGFETIEELDEEDREDLRVEATRRWVHTRTLYLTIILKAGRARGDYVLQMLNELPYAVWRDYDPEDTIRFYGLRMHELGMIKSPPQKLIAEHTDWRLLNELKRELKM